MPDPEWHFEAAAKPAENRREVRRLVRDAPEEARRIFRLEIAAPDSPGEKLSWWWQLVTLVARKPRQCGERPWWKFPNLESTNT